MPALEERVDRLEHALALYLATDERIRRETAAEMREFRDRNARVDAQLLAMQQMADKDRERADRNRERVDAQFIVWQAQFLASQEKAEKERRDFNKRMAELSDSMGTLVEDMVAPNGERIAGQIFPDDPVQFELQRLRRRKGGESMELDLVVVGSRHAMVVEAKRTIRPEDPDAFLEKLKRFKEFFPEYSAHQIIPVMASINIEPSIISNLNTRKVYGLAFGDETFELINLHQF